MSIFTPLEDELSKLWGVVTGEARTAVETALEDAKGEISVLESKAADLAAKVKAAATAAEADIKAAVANDSPDVKTKVETLAAKLVADIEAALSA